MGKRNEYDIFISIAGIYLGSDIRNRSRLLKDRKVETSRTNEEKKTYKIKTKKIKTWRRTHGILTTCQLVNRSKQRTLVFPSCVIFRLF